MPLEVARHDVSGRTLVRVRLMDRRLPVAREDDFLFQNSVELALYNNNSGALYRLYQRCAGLDPAEAPRATRAARARGLEPRNSSAERSCVRVRDLALAGARSKLRPSPSRRAASPRGL